MPERYGPSDASRAPRYSGVRTFARCPYVTEPEGVDVAVVAVAGVGAYLLGRSLVNNTTLNPPTKTRRSEQA